MMKFIQVFTIALFVIAVVLFGADYAYNHYVADKTSPIIRMQSDVIEVEMGATDEELLQGVTASDNRDGDLTKDILVQGVSQLVSDDSAIVTYVVFDSSNNMGTLRRTVRYTNYAKPHFTMKDPLFFSPGSLVNITEHLTASDASGKDFSENINVVSQDVQKNVEGLYSVTVQVSNDMGDYESVTLPLVINRKYANSRPITLTDYIVYVKAGEYYDPMDYIRSILYNDPTEEGLKNVIVDNPVNPDKPGYYTVTYTYDDCTIYQIVAVR